jgi:hypothetical protein
VLIASMKRGAARAAKSRARGVFGKALRAFHGFILINTIDPIFLVYHRVEKEVNPGEARGARPEGLEPPNRCLEGSWASHLINRI